MRRYGGLKVNIVPVHVPYISLHVTPVYIEQDRLSGTPVYVGLCKFMLVYVSGLGHGAPIL